MHAYANIEVGTYMPNANRILCRYIGISQKPRSKIGLAGSLLSRMMLPAGETG